MFPSISFFYHHYHHWIILSMWFWSSWAIVVAFSIVKWFQPHQEAVVQTRLWAECSWSKMWTVRPARERQSMNAMFLVKNPYSEWAFVSMHHLSMIFTRVLLLGGWGGWLQRGLSAQPGVCPQQMLHKLQQQMHVCNFANIGADASLARQLLPNISPEYL